MVFLVAPLNYGIAEKKEVDLDDEVKEVQIVPGKDGTDDEVDDRNESVVNPVYEQQKHRNDVDKVYSFYPPTKNEDNRVLDV